MKSTFHKTLALTLSVSMLAAYTPGFATERVVVPAGETGTISESLTDFNNPALTGGAAQNSGTLNVNDGVSFERNTAHAGGAIYSTGTELNIGNNVSFTENTTAEGQDAGAALYAMGNETATNVVIGDNVKFNQNTSNQKAGAIFLEDANLTIGDNAEFKNNSSVANAGVIYNWDYLAGNSKTIIGKNAVFEGNSAGTNAGVIANYDGDITIGESAKFSNNHANNANGYGGAILNQNYLGTSKLAVGNDASFLNNTAYQGGAIFNSGEIQIGENSVFEGNSATNAGAIYSSGSLTIGDGSKFVSNTAQNYAGAILFQNGDTMTIGNGVEFTGNKSGLSGDAHSGGTIAIDDQGNSAADVKAILMDNVKFTENESTNSGGALYMYASAGKLSLTAGSNAAFTGNKAAKNGGAIANYDGAISIGSGAQFTANSAQVNGGAIANINLSQNTAEMTLTDATFTNNTASQKGGAIYNSGILTLAGTNTFTGNTAAEGADIYNDGTLNLNGTTTIDGGIAGTGDVNVDGTLNIGSTQVAASTIAFADNSTLGVEFGNTDMGNLQANTVTIGNGSNLVVSLSKDFLTTDTTTHDLINSDAAVTGAFTLADVGNALYNVSLNEDNQVIAQRKSQEEQSENVKEVGGTSNDVAVIAAYTSASDLGGETANKVGDIINTLAQTDTAAAVAVTKAIAPEVAPAKQVVHTAVLNEVFGAVQNRLAAATAATPATYALGDSKNYRAANAKNFSVWTQGLLNKSHKEATNNAGAFTGRSTGIAAGADMKPTDNTLVGAGYAYTHTNVSSTGRHDRILGDTFFLYGQYRPSAFYVQGSVAYGDSKYEESKYLPGLTLDADYHVQSYSAQGLVGYDVTDWLSPNFGLRYTRLHQEGYNDGAQDVSADNFDYFTGMLGADLQTQMRVTRNFSLLPHMHAGLAYDFVSADNDGRVALPNGAGYKVYGERLHRLSVELGAGFTARLYQNVEISAAYEGSFREDYNSHTGTLKLRYLF